MGAIARFFQPFHPRRVVSLAHDRGPNPGSARDQEIERDAAADVAEIEQDDKYFAPDTPAEEDELLSPVSHRLGNPGRPRNGLTATDPESPP